MIESEDARLLADIGFLAVSRGLDGESMAIFEGLVAARPEQEAGPIGIALVHLLRGAPAAAAEMLKRLPPSDAAMTFHGLALMRLGDTARARDLLTTVAETALDDAYRALSSELLSSLATR